jgi:lipoprotein NlpI
MTRGVTKGAIFALGLVVALPSIAGAALAQDRSHLMDRCLFLDSHGKSRPGMTPDSAIAACTGLIESSKYAPADVVMGLVARAAAYRSKGDDQRAMADNDEAIRVDPGSSVAFDSRGIVYREKGDFDRAIRDFDQAIRLDPRSAYAFKNRGLAYRDKGNIERALDDFDQAILLKPNFAAAFVARGNTYRREGEYVHAIDDYDEAVRLDPADAAAIDNRGLAYTGKGDYVHAVADYDQAIELDPKDAVAFNNRGRARFALGSFAESATDFAQAAKLRPADAYAVLWPHLARARSGVTDAGELSAAGVTFDPAIWPGPVVAFFLGTSSPETLRQAAELGKTEVVAGQRCEVAFFLGESNVLRGAKAEAEALLRQAVDICPKNFVEYGAAIAELKRSQW